MLPDTLHPPHTRHRHTGPYRHQGDHSHPPTQRGSQYTGQRGPQPQTPGPGLPGPEKGTGETPDSRRGRVRLTPRPGLVGEGPGARLTPNLVGPALRESPIPTPVGQAIPGVDGPGGGSGPDSSHPPLTSTPLGPQDSSRPTWTVQHPQMVPARRDVTGSSRTPESPSGGTSTTPRRRREREPRPGRQTPLEHYLVRSSREGAGALDSSRQDRNPCARGTATSEMEHLPWGWGGADGWTVGTDVLWTQGRGRGGEREQGLGVGWETPSRSTRSAPATTRGR